MPGRCEKLNESRKLDSIKSRLQTTRQRVSIPRLALTVYQEEGIVGFYRGLWIPLITISFVRKCYPVHCAMSPSPSQPLGAASFTIYSRTKEYFRDRHWLSRNRIFDVSAVGGIRYGRFSMSAVPRRFTGIRQWCALWLSDILWECTYVSYLFHTRNCYLTIIIAFELVKVSAPVAGAERRSSL